jgi:small subunit ribosomal protein S6
MFILDSAKYSRDTAGVVAEVEGLIRSHGGQIEISRLYEERRLAYAINGHRKGTYWLSYFRIDGPQIGLLTKQCEINDTILRQLFLKVHPKLEEVVLAHAAGRSVGDAPAEEEVEAPRPAAARRTPVAVGEEG